MTEAVTVTQADREASDETCVALLQVLSAEQIEHFRPALARSFARHRLRASTPASAEGLREAVERLERDASRLDAEAAMDDRAAAASKNPDGAATFALWAVMKRQHAADIRTALAAPEPAGSIEADDQPRIDAWNEFAGDHLTDGKGYAAADVWKRCQAAFDATWPSGPDAAHAAALAALAHPAATPANEVERIRAARTWFDANGYGRLPADAARSLLAALRDGVGVAGPAGWKLVPVEPTEGMCQRAVDYAGPIGCCNHSPSTAAETWREMLAAAPAPAGREAG